jgi:5-methyltetrahydrofolate--homocysteine methyltransferase
MAPILERLKSGDVLVSDGAMGSLLLEQGLETGACPEALNLTRPEVLETIARDYRAAGAEIVQTNTFGASRLKLAPYDLEHSVKEINRSAVAAVRSAVGDGAYVCGSCGPSGRLLEPHGDADPAEVRDGFREQLTALIDAGVDCICVETMTDLEEAALAVSAAKEVSPAIPVLATMTFDPTPRGFFTLMGVSIEDASLGLAAAGADVVGSNCGNGIEDMVRIAGVFQAVSDLPLIIQPNAGLPEVKGDRLEYNETPAFMARRVGALLSAGVSIIGGCCGTTPAHIRAIREEVDSMPAGRGGR